MTHTARLRVFLGDLAYFNRYSSAMLTVPLNIAYIASYALQLYGDAIEVRLFKDARKLLEAVAQSPPDVLGLSCYYWNMHLDALVARRMTQLHPSCLVALGGPSIDDDHDEQLDLYYSFDGHLDVMVLNEGELGFAALLGRVLDGGRSAVHDSPIDGCTCFRTGCEPVAGKAVGLSLDLETLPSPVLGGLLDEFLVADYLPMIQTSRMCPYSCSFCCSGKLQGKLRTFPVNLVANELDYIAARYGAYPHRPLFITDENFGISRRDVAVASALAETKKARGYPLQVFCYFDKKLSDAVKKSALLFADMNSGGLQLAFQSFNKDSLAAVKRRNMTDRDILGAVAWATAHGLRTSSEMIFGLPYETRGSFLDSLEHLMQLGIDSLAAHNLFLMKGIELNRTPQRARFGLVTKFRPSCAAAYDIIENEFVCETEEVVVSSSHFSYDDFMAIRKISLMFYAVHALGFFKPVFAYLIARKHKVVPLFDAIMTPAAVAFPHTSPHNEFVGDFVRASQEELFSSHDDVSAHLMNQYVRNGNRVTAPPRLNVLYASRLIYRESIWFPVALDRIVRSVGITGRDLGVIQDLAAFSSGEWVDLRNPERARTVEVCHEALNWLETEIPAQAAARYRLTLSTSHLQRQLIESYNKQFSSDDDSYYYNVLDFIQPRKHLRYDRIQSEPLEM